MKISEDHPLEHAGPPARLPQPLIRSMVTLPVRGAGQDLSGGHQAIHLTKLLSATLGDNPAGNVAMLLPRDYERLEAKVLAVDYPVVLAQSKEMAEAAANAAQATGPTQVSSGSAVAAGAGNTVVTLPAGAIITGINLATTVGAAATATQVTVSNVAGGTITFEYVSPASGIPYWPNPVPPGGLAPASPTAVPTVTFIGVTNTGPGFLTVLGTVPAAITQAPVGSYLPAGVDRTIRSCDELWAAAISPNTGRVSVIASRRLGIEPATGP